MLDSSYNQNPNKHLKTNLKSNELNFFFSLQHRWHRPAVRGRGGVGVDRVARDAAAIAQSISQETGATLVQPSFKTNPHLLENGEAHTVYSHRVA